MFARALLVLLAVLNLGIALWWWRHEPAAPVPVEESTGVPRLRLPSESRDAAPTPVAPATAVAAAAGLPADAACASLGPYADAAAAATAQARVASRALHSRIVERAVGRARGWRVLVPPLPTAADAEALAARIAAAGVSDYFVMREGDDANAVALGRYQGEQAARRRAQTLAAAGFPQVRAEPLGVARQQWLDVALAAGADFDALRATADAAQARPLDCETLRQAVGD